MKAKCILFCLTWLIHTPVFSQDNTFEYFITASANLYVPISSDKNMYPVLGLEKTAKPKLLIGGFGMGFSGVKQIKQKLAVKWQGNVSRSVYWDEYLEFRNESNQPLGIYATSSTDYSVGILGTIQYSLSQKFSIGTGGGLRAMVVSMLYLRSQTVPFEGNRYLGRNRFFKPFMPVVPLELCYRMKNSYLNVRYEQALLNRFKKEIAEEKNDRYGVLFFEIGFKI
jgi:hypothetical protein